MIRTPGVALAAVAGVTNLSGQTSAPDWSGYAHRAESVFNPAWLNSAASDLNVACDRLLLVAQGIAALVIVGALLVKMRRVDQRPEGIAATLLLVAFIATTPVWQSLVLDSVPGLVQLVQTPRDENVPRSVPNELWTLASTWMPPGSPLLDALADQAVDAPEPGDEAAWHQRGWNWARGVGTASADMFHNLWLASAGSLRAWSLHLACAAASCGILGTILATYLATMARTVILAFGFAGLPVAIAGLGSDVLRGPSIKAILMLAGVALWPIAWAICDIPTGALVEALNGWSHDTAALALGIPSGQTDVPTLAVAAPFLAWGVLLLLGTATAVVCAWCLANLLLGPWLINRIVSAGTTWVGSTSTVFAAADQAAARRSIGSRDDPAPVPGPGRRAPDLSPITMAIARPANPSIQRLGIAASLAPRSLRPIITHPSSVNSAFAPIPSSPPEASAPHAPRLGPDRAGLITPLAEVRPRQA